MSALAIGGEIACPLCLGEEGAGWTHAAAHPAELFDFELGGWAVRPCRSCRESRRFAGILGIVISEERAAQLSAALEQARLEVARRDRVKSRLLVWWRIRLRPEHAIADGRPLWLSRSSATGGQSSWTPKVEDAYTWAEHEANTASLVAARLGELERFEARLPDGEKLPALGGSWRPHMAPAEERPS